MKHALILVGGGVAGIAWELGVLRGLQDADPDLDLIAADLIVGTSAGSAVAAQITSGTPLADLYAAQLTEVSAEIEVELDMEALFARFTAATADAASRDEVQRAIGAVALDTETVAEPVRRAAVAARLPVPSWPDRPMLLPAVDADGVRPRGPAGTWAVPARPRSRPSGPASNDHAAYRPSRRRRERARAGLASRRFSAVAS